MIVPSICVKCSITSWKGTTIGRQLLHSIPKKNKWYRKTAVVATEFYVHYFFMFVQNVNTVYQSEVTGPTAEFQFKHGSNSSVKVGYKKLKTKEWNVTISPEHDKVHYFLYN